MRNTKKTRCLQWPRAFYHEVRFFHSMDQRSRPELCRSQANLVSSGLKPVLRR